jgi:hypothetical protein
MAMVSVVLIVSFLLSFLRALRCLVVQAGQARDVAGDDAGRDEVHGDLPGGAGRLVSQAVVAMDQAAFWPGERASHH